MQKRDQFWRIAAVYNRRAEDAQTAAARASYARLAAQCRDLAEAADQAEAASLGLSTARFLSNDESEEPGVLDPVAGQLEEGRPTPTATLIGKYREHMQPGTPDQVYISYGIYGFPVSEAYYLRNGYLPDLALLPWKGDSGGIAAAG